MSTRGAIGFYYKGQEKVTYNHFDSYPTGLGASVLNTVRAHSDAELLKAAKGVRLITGKRKPTEKQIEAYKKYADTGVSTGQITEWYCLLRNAQGTLEPYITDNLRHMEDNKDFLYDSLFCEWAYIVNVDEGVLEIYKGFNEDPLAPGRYAAEHRDQDGKFYGVVLIAEYPFDQLRKMPEEWTDTLLKELEKEAEEEGHPTLTVSLMDRLEGIVSHQPSI